MSIDHIDNWAQFGLAGLVIAALFMMLKYLTCEHRAERKEWIVAYREQSKMMTETQVETNAVIRELVSAVKESNIRSSHRVGDGP